MPTILNNQSQCKSCFGTINATLGMKYDKKPKEGDISVCAYCGVVSTFDAELNLIPMPQNEIERMRIMEPENYKIVQLLSIGIKERIKRN